MKADLLLSSLEGVIGGGGHWRARCPGHKSKSRSLAIREVDDRILIHCFAGCEPNEVLSAIGLTIDDLFDKPLATPESPALKPLKNPFLPFLREQLRDMRRELTVALIHLGDVEHNRTIIEADKQRAGKAARALAKWLSLVQGDE